MWIFVSLNVPVLAPCSKIWWLELAGDWHFTNIHTVTTLCLTHLIFIHARICRWNCLDVPCILCSLQFEMDSLPQAHISQWQEDVRHSLPKNFFGKKNCLGSDWSYLSFLWSLFACFGRKTKYFWSHKNLNQKSSAQGLCSSPASVVISCCLFHLDCFSFKLFLLWTLQKARNGCFRILFSVLIYNTHW